ncbi:MAG TPA: tetratricopeptide repeat protein [Candidatus Limnocylindria bacterium]|nr:tetratricopeptide repeat protein [Candidatus Limnocylindria bacterium]
MPQLPPKTLVAGILALWLAAGCTSPAPKATAAKTSKPATRTKSTPIQPVESEADTEKRVRAYAAFAAGISRQLNDDFEGMLRYFEKSVVNDPGNESLALEVARRRLGKNQPKAAEALLRAVAARPDASGEIHAVLGMALVQLGRTNEALASYRKALSLEPAAIGPLQGVAQLLVEKSEMGTALKALDAAPRGTNVATSYLVDLGELYAQVGAHDPKLAETAQKRLLELYSTALSRKPDDPVLLQRIADRYSSLGMNKDAEPILKQLREKYSQNPLPAARLAELYMRQGRMKEARQQLESVSRLDPTNALPFYYLGLISMEEKELERARNQFQRAILLNPSLALPYPELATVFMNLGQPAEALKTLEDSRKQFPADFRTEFLESLAEGRLKHFDAAFDALMRAEAVAKTNNPALIDHRFYFQVGAVLEEKDDHAKAEEYLKKSLALKPDFVEALNHLGYMWAEAGVKLPEARAMIEKAVKAEPENGAYLDSLGWVLYKQGKFAEAVPVLEKANKLMPEPDATVLDHLADAYAALKRWPEAKDTWKKSLAVEASDKVKQKLDAAP